MRISTLLKIQALSHLIAFGLLMLYAAQYEKYVLIIPSLLLFAFGLMGTMAIGPQRELEEGR